MVAKKSSKLGEISPSLSSAITALYLELSKLNQQRNFEKAIKVCNKILNLSAKDETAFLCKIVSLIHTSRFEDALKQMKNAGVYNLDTTFEQAYCLYRLDKLTEAHEMLLGKMTELDDRETELCAQILYRLEFYTECFDIYRKIIKHSTGDDFESERLANFSAVRSFLPLEIASNVALTQVDDDDSYEVFYNNACGLLTEERWGEAENFLQIAKKKCLSQNERDEDDYVEEDEDFNDDEMKREIGIIQTQIAYCFQRQGGEEKKLKAQAIYNSELNGRHDDMCLAAVISNNLMVLNGDQKIFDSRKKLKVAMTEGLEHKLTSAQKHSIARNATLLAMYTNQVDQCRALLDDLGQRSSQDDRDRIYAAVLSRSGRTIEAVDILMSGDGSLMDLERVLIAVHILLEKKKIKESLELLKRLPLQHKTRLGVLSCMVNLYLAVGNYVGAAEELKSAASIGHSNKKYSEISAVIWRKTAEFYLKNGGDPIVAAEALEELLKTQQGESRNRQTLAQLVLAYAKFDLVKAQRMSKKLPNLHYSMSDAELAALEASSFVGSRYTPSSLKKTVAGSNVLAEDNFSSQISVRPTGETIRKKKKRKKKLPKNYNPNVDPDPERWLAKRDRTGYRRFRKDRKKVEKFTGAQGVSVGQTEVLDYSVKKATSATAPGHDSPKCPVSAKSVTGPRQQQRKFQQKKKNKRKGF